MIRTSVNTSPEASSTVAYLRVCRGIAGSDSLDVGEDPVQAGQVHLGPGRFGGVGGRGQERLRTDVAARPSVVDDAGVRHPGSTSSHDGGAGGLGAADRGGQPAGPAWGGGGGLGGD